MIRSSLPLRGPIGYARTTGAVSCALLHALNQVGAPVGVDHARRREHVAPVQADAHARAHQRQVVLLALPRARPPARFESARYCLA